MPKVSSKRQITLPVDQCRQEDIGPGDEYNSYVDNYGHITIIKILLEVQRDYLKGYILINR
jgi:bifunctional DNA-binding transcriptional regulator/antitoxin component of YhaV-PrlF toxin-antitoxin module